MFSATLLSFSWGSGQDHLLCVTTDLQCTSKLFLASSKIWSLSMQSMFANNALLGGGVRVRVWIREQRKIKRKSKTLLRLWWQTWTSLGKSDLNALVLFCCQFSHTPNRGANPYTCSSSHRHWLKPMLMSRRLTATYYVCSVLGSQSGSLIRSRRPLTQSPRSVEPFGGRWWRPWQERFLRLNSRRWWTGCELCVGVGVGGGGEYEGPGW